MRVSDATLGNEAVALSVVEVVIAENQIITVGRERATRGCETGRNGDAVLGQELPCDDLCEDCMVLDEKDVHATTGVGGLTPELSDRRWKRAQAVSDDVHKSNRVKTETLSGGSLDSLVRCSSAPTE
jgi:hypothetical protein